MFKEIKSLQLPEIDREILDFWQQNKIFEKSITSRSQGGHFVFYEGPRRPTANREYIM